VNGARRLLLSGVALTALLAAVAVASRAHRPGGGPGGGTSHAPRPVFEYTASALFVLMPIGILVVLWVASLGRRQRLLEGGAKKKQFQMLLLVCCVGPPLLLVGRHYIHYHSPPQQSDPNLGSSKAAPGHDAAGGNAEFQWLPAVGMGTFILGVAGGTVALILWKRRQGPAWEREAELAAALDEVLADTLDDLRAERDPRRAVIGAYARLERTFAAHDVAREPSETPREYVDRALDRLGVSMFAVKRLTQLYERAKFSPHEIDAAMKDDAIDALAGLRAELDSDTEAAA
jgi:Domain of unknown function (DUF4129)